MNKVMKITYNGTGLVNNRGISKYWGVSADPVNKGQWRVLVNIKESMYTFALPSEIVRSEDEAAHIAKHLYKFHFAGQQLPGFIYINSTKLIGKLYRLDFINNTIVIVPRAFEGLAETFNWELLETQIENANPSTKFKASKQKLPTVAKKKEIGTEDEYDFAKEISEMINPFNLPSHEEEVIREFVNNVLSDKMTQRGRKVLNTMAAVLSE